MNHANTSLGHLLRVIHESSISHVDIAIQEMKINIDVKLEQSKFISTVQQTQSDTNIPSNQNLSLKDHSRISAMQKVMKTILQAIHIQSNGNAIEKNINKNLIITMTNALIEKCMSDCKSTKINICHWGKSTQKLFKILHWMALISDALNEDMENNFVWYVIESHLQSKDSTMQLNACLVLFELSQIHRYEFLQLSNLISNTVQVQILQVYRNQLLSKVRLLQPLVHIVQKAQVNRDKKPTTLSLVALETLVVLTSDIAVLLLDYTNSMDNGQSDVQISSTLQQEFVIAVDFILNTYKTWYKKSQSRLLVFKVVCQLHSYVKQYYMALNKEQMGFEAVGTLRTPLTNIICWHWASCALLIVSRSREILRLKKVEMMKILQVEFNKISYVEPKPFDYKVAQVRRFALLMAKLIYPIQKQASKKQLSESRRDDVVEQFAQLIPWLIDIVLCLVESDFVDLHCMKLIAQMLTILLVNNKVVLVSNSSVKNYLVLAQLFDSIKHLEHRLLTKNAPRYSNCVLIELFATLLLQWRHSLNEYIINPIITCNVTSEPYKQTQLTLSIKILREVLRFSCDIVDPLVANLSFQLCEAITPLFFHPIEAIRLQVLSCIPFLPIQNVVSNLLYRKIFLKSQSEMHMDLHRQKSMSEAIYFAIYFAVNHGRFSNNELADIVSICVDFARHNKSNMAHSELATESCNRVTPRTVVCANLNDADVLSWALTGWCSILKTETNREIALFVLLRKLMVTSPNDSYIVQLIRELISCGWVSTTKIFEYLLTQVTDRLNAQGEPATKHSQILVSDFQQVSLFDRLAPLLILRMLPRFMRREEHSTIDARIRQKLFDLLSNRVLDLQEFKEVKLLAVEGYSHFNIHEVLQMISANLIKFIQETAADAGNQLHAFFMSELENIGLSGLQTKASGVVTAKLMLYSLSRLVHEDAELKTDKFVLPFVISILFQLLSIEISSELERDLVDLQTGVMDCLATLLARPAVEQEKRHWEHSNIVLAMLINCICNGFLDNKYSSSRKYIADTDNPKFLQEKLLRWEEVQLKVLSSTHSQPMSTLPLQFRICCSNILVVSLRQYGNTAATLLLNTEEGYRDNCLLLELIQSIPNLDHQELVAGILQIIFALLYHSTDLNKNDFDEWDRVLQEIFGLAINLIQSSSDHNQIKRIACQTKDGEVPEQVCWEALKVVGALIGKYPGFVQQLPIDSLNTLHFSLLGLRNGLYGGNIKDLAGTLAEAVQVWCIEAAKK